MGMKANNKSKEVDLEIPPIQSNNKKKFDLNLKTSIRIQID